MPLDTSIPLQTLMRPQDLGGSLLGGIQAGQNIRLRELQIDEAAAQQEQGRALRDVFRAHAESGTMGSEGFLRDVGRISPTMSMELRREQGEQVKLGLDIEKRKLDIQTDFLKQMRETNDFVLQKIGACIELGDTPAGQACYERSKAEVRDFLSAAGADTTLVDNLPQKMDVQMLNAARMQRLTTKDQLDLAWQDKEQERKTIELSLRQAAQREAERANLAREAGISRRQDIAEEQQRLDQEYRLSELPRAIAKQQALMPGRVEEAELKAEAAELPRRETARIKAELTQDRPTQTDLALRAARGDKEAQAAIKFLKPTSGLDIQFDKDGRVIAVRQGQGMAKAPQVVINDAIQATTAARQTNRLIGEIRNIVEENPSAASVAGSMELFINNLRSNVMNLAVPEGPEGKKLLQNIQTADISEFQFLQMLLTFQVALIGNPDGRISDADIRNAQRALGSGSAVRSAQDLIPRLNAFERILKSQFEDKAAILRQAGHDVAPLEAESPVAQEVAPQPALSIPTITEADITATMQSSGRSRQEVIDAFRSKGYALPEGIR